MHSSCNTVRVSRVLHRFFNLWCLYKSQKYCTNVCAEVQTGLAKVDGSRGSGVVWCDDFGEFLLGSANSEERMAYAKLAKLFEARKAVACGCCAYVVILKAYYPKAA